MLNPDEKSVKVEDGIDVGSNVKTGIKIDRVSCNGLSVTANLGCYGFSIRKNKSNWCINSIMNYQIKRKKGK